MPELPEVETIKRSLSRKIIGKKIKTIKVLKPKIFIGNPKEVEELKIKSLSRRAKILFFHLTNKKNLMIHLKLTGQIVWSSQKGKSITFGHPIPHAGIKLPAKTTHIIITLDKGKLFYNDLRQFGWIKIINDKDINKEIQKFGPEPLSKNFNVNYLQKIFSKTKRPTKLVLMDQNKIAGIGNIYSNDALYEAGINPLKPANRLKKTEIKKLKQSIIKVIKESIKFKGCSDNSYVLPNGHSGKYQEHFKVYQQDGKKCKKCNSVIKRIKQAGRGTFYCPKCQR